MELTERELKEHLKNAQHVPGLVLDELRLPGGNGGYFAPKKVIEDILLWANSPD